MNFRTITLLILTLAFYKFSFGQTIDDYLIDAGERNTGLRARYNEYLSALQGTEIRGGLPSPEVGMAYFLSPVETRLGPQTARFSVMQMFPWFGTINSRKDVETSRAEVKFYEFIKARDILFRKVETSWLELISLKLRLGQYEAQFEILESLKTLAETRFENSTGTMVDVLRVELEIEKILLETRTIPEEEGRAKAKFMELLSRDSLSNFQIPSGFPEPILSADDSSSYSLDSILRNNPDVRIVSQRISTEQLKERVIKKEGNPSFGLGMTYIVTSERQDLQVPNNGRDAFFPFISLSVPIYRKQIRAKLERSDLNKSVFQYQLSEIRTRLRYQYESLQHKVRIEREVQKSLESQIKVLQQIESLLITSYSVSGKEMEEILKVENDILKLRLEMISSKYREFSLLATIRSMAGKI